MLSKTKLKMLLGAAALGAAGHALAQTNAGSGGTIWLTVDDVTTGSSYVFDTGMSVSSFTGTSNYSTTFSDANWTSFVSSVAGGNLATTSDILHFAVSGASSSASSGAVPVTIDLTGTASQNPVANSSAGTMYTQAFNLLSFRVNPASGDTFLPAGSATNAGWFTGGYETNFQNAAGNTDWSGIGGTLGFYQTNNSSHSGALTKGTASTFAGTWDLTAQGAFSYTTAAAVPLPAPLLLLLSGLGLTGLLGRRGKLGSGETRAVGAA